MARLLRLSAGVIPAVLGLVFMLITGKQALTQSLEPQADKYIEDRLTFIGEFESRPVLLIATFSRGRTGRDTNSYAAECTGHLFWRERWTHIGPGGYASAETTLVTIPSGPSFQVRGEGVGPGFVVEFENRGRPLRLALDSSHYIHREMADADYQQHYRRGWGTLCIGADTVKGTILHRKLDFTGYNRLSGNISGYFPGKYEQAVLIADDGSMFILSTDPIAAKDTANRVKLNFAVAYKPYCGIETVFDSLETGWPQVNDTLYPGKPLPLRWISTVNRGKWQAEYRDLGHFFYFTGYGIFGVSGTMHKDDTTYQVRGMVEHIHARDKPR